MIGKGSTETEKGRGPATSPAPFPSPAESARLLRFESLPILRRVHKTGTILEGLRDDVDYPLRSVGCSRFRLKSRSPRRSKPSPNSSTASVSPTATPKRLQYPRPQTIPNAAQTQIVAAVVSPET